MNLARRLSQKGGVTLVAANQPALNQPTLSQPSGIEPSPRPRNPNQESVLGKKDAVDQINAPASLPKGMLAFLRGLDSLNAFHLDQAIDAFSEAIESESENADFYAARGSTYVVAQKMEQGLPDLQRAMQLNPDKVLASRMTRLAYLMMGDQLKASRFYGHGSTQNVDFLITEIGTAYGQRMTSQRRGYRMERGASRKRRRRSKSSARWRRSLAARSKPAMQSRLRHSLLWESSSSTRRTSPAHVAAFTM